MTWRRNFGRRYNAGAVLSRSRANVREQQIVQYSMEGYSKQEVCEVLNIKPASFDRYLRDRIGSSQWPVSHEHHPN